MSSRAVLIGTISDSKIFYLLDQRDDGKDAALLMNDGRIEYVKLFDFISKNTGISEFKFTPFHQFIWEPDEGEEEDRWNRIFVNKTQNVTESMLVGVDVVNNFGKKNKSRSINNKADAFQRMTRSTGMDTSNPLFISRKSTIFAREITGKALGRSISMKPNIDGDGDGFVDDGLPTMRPFIPGFDFDLDAVASSSRSLRTAPASTVEHRKKSLEQMNSTVDGILAFAEFEFNDGKPIKTKQDAIRALTKAIPSFGKMSKKERSSIQFIDDLMTDDAKLEQWHQEYIAQFLMLVGTHPLRNSVTYEIGEIDPSTDPRTGGSTSPSFAAKRWKRYPMPQTRFVPIDTRKGKIKVNYRRPDSSWQLVKFASAALDPKENNFNVLSASFRDGVRADVADAQISAAFLNLVGTIEQLKSEINPIAEAFRKKNSPISPIEAMAAAQSISRAHSILDQIGAPGVGPDDIKLMQILANSDDAALIAELNAVNKRADDIFAIPAVALELKRFKDISDKWARLESVSTGAHETTHILQMLTGNAKVEARARELQKEFIEQQLRNAELSNGRKFTSAERKVQIGNLEQIFPMESFIFDVLKEKLSEFAKTNPDRMKLKLLAWATDSGVLPTHGKGFQWKRFGEISEKLIASHASMENDLLNMSNQEIIAKYGVDKQTLRRRIDAYKEFFYQRLALSNETIKINPEVSRVIKEASGQLNTSAMFGSAEPGDDLTLGHLVFLYSYLLENESASHTLFRNLSHSQITDSPISITNALGYPTIKVDRQKIKGISADNSRPLVEGLIAASPVIEKFLASASIQGMPMGRILGLRQDIGEVSLPPSFGGMKYDDLMQLDKDSLIAMTLEAMDSLAEDLVSPNSSDPSNTGAKLLLDMPRFLMEDFSSFSDDEIDQLIEISGKIGLPTGRLSDPAYSSYQATLLAAKIQLLPQAFSLWEFGAETVLADLFGVPLSQVLDSGLDTRSLTNNELQLLNRYLMMLFPNGLPSDILERMYA